ncbi:ClpX C4-type zinc finger protein [Lysinibacillus sp. NPDC096418]|uniref:ClpX C4-type zinc finger protein n=1 Tax=Lysinibacillus sp. NPDC096418 TaxID=3364138 RepID=UPI00380638C4
MFDELYNGLEKTSNEKNISNSEKGSTCSFCRRTKEEVGELVNGPGVTICKSCLEFGAEIIKSLSLGF